MPEGLNEAPVMKDKEAEVQLDDSTPEGVDEPVRREGDQRVEEERTEFNALVGEEYPEEGISEKVSEVSDETASQAMTGMTMVFAEAFAQDPNLPAQLMAKIQANQVPAEDSGDNQALYDQMQTGQPPEGMTMEQFLLGDLNVPG